MRWPASHAQDGLAKCAMERAQDLVVPVLQDPKQAEQLQRARVKLHGQLLMQLSTGIGCSPRSATFMKWITT